MEENRPDWLPDQVRQVLRDWHRGPSTPPPLLHTVLMQRHLEDIPSPSPIQVWQAGKELVLYGLETLHAQGQVEHADLLRLRFLSGMPAHQVGYRLNVSQELVYLRQRQAIEELADVLWREEWVLRKERARQSAGRLPPRDASRLFGVDEKLAQLSKMLGQEDDEVPILALDGIGGIGKTTLANAAAHQFLGSPRYTSVAWVSARQHVLTAWGGIVSSEQPALTLEGLVDDLVEQLGLAGLTHLPPEQKANGLKQVLQERPCLVVVDNLETAVDHRALVPHLQSFAESPSKFLITSRYSLRQYSGVYSISLNELSEQDTLDLLRHEFENRGLHDLADAADDVLRPVHQVVGGNPLALKLVVGQASLLPLPRVLENLREAQGKSAEDLYRYVYWHAWRQLDEDARHVLILMPLFAEDGVELSTIEKRSDVKGARLTDALARLATLSLVNVSGDPLAWNYSIHRLTESFLMREVIKWEGDYGEDDESLAL